MSSRAIQVTEISRLTARRAASLCLFQTAVPAGFPSPADDYTEQTIDLNEWLIKNKLATFLVRAEGDSMAFEFHSGDTLIVDRSIEPKSGDIVIAYLDGEFTVKRWLQDGDKHFLIPANPAHPKIELNGEEEFIIWGVVTFTIHKVR